jgi:hypothetical protein
MARRRESIVDILFVLPWWVSLIAAAVVYGVCTFVLPAYFGSAARRLRHMQRCSVNSWVSRASCAPITFDASSMHSMVRRRSLS